MTERINLVFSFYRFFQGSVNGQQARLSRDVQEDLWYSLRAERVCFHRLFQGTRELLRERNGEFVPIILIFTFRLMSRRDPITSVKITITRWLFFFLPWDCLETVSRSSGYFKREETRIAKKRNFLNYQDFTVYYKICVSRILHILRDALSACKWKVRISIVILIDLYFTSWIRLLLLYTSCQLFDYNRFE